MREPTDEEVDALVRAAGDAEIAGIDPSTVLQWRVAGKADIRAGRTETRCAKLVERIERAMDAEMLDVVRKAAETEPRAKKWMRDRDLK